VPDWSALVHSRLTALGLDADREEQIRAELAGHLEDVYADARLRGCPEEEAVARALERVPDWTHLARTIRRADQQEDPMSHHAKTLWLPGMTALCGAAAVLVGTPLLVPSSLWVDSRLWVRVLMVGLPLSSYLAFGALGAWWSRRAGGSITDRFFAGVFPLALHLAMIVPTIVVSMMSDIPRHPEYLQPNFQLRVALAFVVIPGVALTIGTLPFLRDRAKTRAA
jgi:hypothetical protein